MLILESLARIETRLEEIVSSEADLQNALDKIKAGVQAQAQKLADLSAQIAAGTPVDQAQLDALVAEANDIAALLPSTT